MSSSQSPSAQAVNSGNPAAPQSFPRPLSITLTLALEVQTQEQLDSMIDLSTNEITIPFIGDLFDQLSSMYGLPITTINGKSFKDVQKYFESTL